MKKASTPSNWFPPTLPMAPSFAEAKQYVRELMFSEYAYHFDDGVWICFENAGVSPLLLKTLFWNEHVLWNNFSADQIWDQMCPTHEERVENNAHVTW